MRHQDGFVMLAVVIALVIVASVAMLFSTEGAMQAERTVRGTEALQADYLARAAMDHAMWRNDANVCLGSFNVPSTSLGAHSYAATVTGGGTTTFYNLGVDQDAWIRSDDVTRNNGTTADNHLRFESGNNEQSLTRFDLSAVPAGAQINSATGWFYVSGGGAHPEGPVTLHAVTTDWTETGATWDTMNGRFDSSILATISVQPDDNIWVSVNLTAQVQAWANGQDNYGILMRSASEGVHAKYESREGSEPPYLEVVVGSVPASPVSIQATGTLENGISRVLSQPLTTAYQPPVIHTFNPGAAEGEDAEIWDQSPNNNYGNAAETWVSSASNDTTRSLLHFNINAIPAGARVLSATLSLRRQSGTGTNQPVSAHRIMNPWSEASVSWNKRESGTDWDTAGSDFDSTAVATTPIGPGNTRYEWNIAPLVQGWIDGSYPNYGVALVAAIAGIAGHRFYTSDTSDPTNRPSLTVTYACECSSACLAPGGAGGVLLVIGGSPASPSAFDVALRDRLESWGYTVTLIQDDDSQGNYDAGIGNNDVVLVSQTVDSNNVGAKLTGTAAGVVNMEGLLNDELGIATGNSWPVGSQLDIVDASHYITAVFASGPLDFYSGAMEGLTASGTEAPTRLANWGGAGALVAIDTGAPLAGGGTAAGRRVLFPFGRENTLNLDYVNNNGWLLLQRALAWSTNANFVPVGNVLMVVDRDTNLTSQETQKKTLIESWGYNVSVIDEDASQGVFDTVFAENDVVFVSEDANAGDIGGKLTGATIGVVIEEAELVSDLGLAGGVEWSSGTQLQIDNNTHYITRGFAGGNLTVLTTTESLAYVTLSFLSDLELLGRIPGGLALTALESGASLAGGGTAAGRRVLLPWGGNNMDLNSLNADGLTIFKRAIEWGIGAEFTDIAVVASSDDAEQLTGNGTMYVNSTDLELADNVVFATAQPTDIVGIRFADVFVSQGAQIKSAHIQFQVDELDSGAATLLIAGEAIDDAAPFTIDPFNISSRPRTAASVTWSPPEWTVVGERGSDQRTADISAVIREIVNRPGWVSGNALAVIISGPGTRTAEAYDGDPAGAPMLHIEFVGDGSGAGGGGSTGMIAHWKLDDGKDLTAIDSEGGHHGTLENDPLWSASGAIDGALNFDGTNDFVEVPHDDALSLTSTFTISAWVRNDAPSVSGTHRILSKERNGANDSYWMSFQNGTLFVGVGGRFHSAPGIFENNTWYHLVVTFDDFANELVIYVNGVAVLREYTTATLTPNSDPLYIGTNWEGTKYWNGLLDDVRIYDQVLDDSEVAAISSAGGVGGGDGGDSDRAGVVYESFAEAKRSNNDNSLSIGKPAGTATGDLLIAVMVTDGQQVDAMSISGGGWTRIDHGDHNERVTMDAWWKLAGSTEPASYDFRWDKDERAYGWIMRFTGHDAATPIDAVASRGGGSGSPTSPAINTSMPDVMILRLGGFDDDDVTVDNTGLAGHTNITMDESSSGTGTASGGAGYVMQSAAGSSGTANFSLTGSEEYRTLTLGIRPSP